MVKIFDKIRASRIFQTCMRVLQFLSSVISLGLFSSRLYKVYRLERRTSHSTGAVEGILAAATLYTIATTLINCCLRSKTAPKFLRWLLIALDVAFVGAFIAVADLTKPNGGLSGNNSSRFCYNSAMRDDPARRNDKLCKLPLGTFVLAIVSTILHFITAVFHEIRDKHRANKQLSNEDGYHGSDKHRANKQLSNEDGYHGSDKVGARKGSSSEGGYGGNDAYP